MQFPDDYFFSVNEVGQLNVLDSGESSATFDSVVDSGHVSALEKPFVEYSVAEILVLLILIIISISFVLPLFTRKWGFSEW